MMTEPFTWALVEDQFARGFLQRLAREFPNEGFSNVASRDAAKPYAMRHRTLLRRGALDGTPEAATPTVWREFLRLIRAPTYRDFIQGWCPRPLAACRWEINWWSYDAGSWIAPHCDKPDKLVSHIIYLNEDWQAAWGGCCRILASEDLDDVCAEILPTLAQSLVIVRSDSSWHAVTPVVNGEHRRNSVQVVLWAGD